MPTLTPEERERIEASIKQRMEENKRPPADSPGSLAVAKAPDLLAQALEDTKQVVALSRANETNMALEPAYAKASELRLEEDEMERLTEVFPDDAVEIRPHDGLLYIPHIFISERLNEVLGQGQWSMIRRREFMEDNNIYAEWVMKIRGCFVGESIGAQAYIAKNKNANYSDALEGTRGEALRRIAAKDLSCGSQVWKPSYCRQWISENAVAVWCVNKREGNVKKMWRLKSAPPIDMYPWAEQEGKKPRVARPTTVEVDSTIHAPASPPSPESATGPGHPEEEVEPPGGWQGATRPPDPAEADFEDAVPAEPPPKAQPAKDEWWRQVKIHFGKWRGTPIGQVPKGSLQWFCLKWQPQPFRGKISKSDTDLRFALDAAQAHYQFKEREKGGPDPWEGADNDEHRIPRDGMDEYGSVQDGEVTP